jgi:hypothetical protein
LPGVSPPAGLPRKAENEPVCAWPLVTAGEGAASRITHGEKLPVSNPPFVMAPDVHGVDVGVGVKVGVKVGVLVGGVPVTVGVGVGALQPGNLKLPMRVRQLNELVTA